MTITQVEAAQIKSYADPVATDPQFHSVKVHWDFWVISSDLDSTVARDASQPNLPHGQIASWGNIRIWAKTWSQLIDECETRLRHFRDALEYDASREHAADYINRAHDAKHVPAPLRAIEGGLRRLRRRRIAPARTGIGPRGPRDRDTRWHLTGSVCCPFSLGRPVSP